jgi:hypothetical protein
MQPERHPRSVGGRPGDGIDAVQQGLAGAADDPNSFPALAGDRGCV